MEDDSDDNVSIKENYADELSDAPPQDSDEWDSDDVDHDSESLKTLGSDTEDDDPLEWDDEDPPRNNEPFLGSPGPTFDTVVAPEIIIAKFIDDDFFEMIVKETNKYYNQNSQIYVPVNNSKWVDVTVSEMKRWFGLVLLTSVESKISSTDPWSKLPMYIHPVFAKVMTRERFFDISLFLHFSDNAIMPVNASRLFKVQSLLDYFPEKFKSLYKPSQNLSMIETIIPWGSKLKFKSYKPSEIHTSGLFIRRVHESATGYVTNVSITEDAPLPFQTAVANLVDPKWHNLYIDNFFKYNYIKIARRLLANKIRMCTPVKSGEKLLRCLKKTKPRTFESKIKRKDEILLQMSKFPYGEKLCMVSTIHNGGVVESKRLNRRNKPSLNKPTTLMDYNKCMTGVNTADKYLKCHMLYQTTKKWSKKVLVYVLNCALFNAYTLSKTNDPNVKTMFHEFVLKVAEIWIDHEACNSNEWLNSDESKHEDLDDIGDGSSYDSLFDEPDSSD